MRPDPSTLRERADTALALQWNAARRGDPLRHALACAGFERVQAEARELDGDVDGAVRCREERDRWLAAAYQLLRAGR
ncbi:MAG TPA: hypothetical protein VEI97_14465 [bacterium]|nr:hypothetical protein [bacterium]